MGTPAPPCRRLGRQCHSLPVTLRIGALEEGVASLDHEATWLLGHTQQITFRDIWTGEGELYVDATLHVVCRHLREDGSRATCGAHGFRGPNPRPSSARRPQIRQLGSETFVIVDQMSQSVRTIPALRPKRVLPVLPSAVSVNPCATAPCRTADNTQGAACCRDLQVEIMCTKRQTGLEALVRSRKSPYLCKVTREGDYSIDAEMISACGYLEPGGVNCTLHGRKRADGRSAKPDLCFDWPPKDQGLHPGCVFGPKPRKRAAR